MIGFVMDQLLQSVKIFACQNIPLTQFLTAIYLIAFVIPEIIRAIAGEAPEVEIAINSSVNRAKVRFEKFQRDGLLGGGFAGWSLDLRFLGCSTSRLVY
jgi:hypothetical protein